MRRGGPSRIRHPRKSNRDYGPDARAKTTLTEGTKEHLQVHYGWNDEQLSFLDDAIEAQRKNHLDPEKPGYFFNNYSPTEARIGRISKRTGERPFRKGKTTSIFPADTTPEEVLRAFRASRENLHKVFDDVRAYKFKYKGNEYEISVCQRAGCKLTNPDRVLGEGDIASIYPTCGPTIRKIVPLSRAKEILFGGGTLTRESFLQASPCE